MRRATALPGFTQRVDEITQICYTRVSTRRDSIGSLFSAFVTMFAVSFATTMYQEKSVTHGLTYAFILALTAWIFLLLLKWSAAKLGAQHTRNIADHLRDQITSDLTKARLSEFEYYLVEELYLAVWSPVDRNQRVHAWLNRISEASDGFQGSALVAFVREAFPTTE